MTVPVLEITVCHLDICSTNFVKLPDERFIVLNIEARHQNDSSFSCEDPVCRPCLL